MKRWRHYTQDTAIILSAFGSIPERARYDALQEYVAQHFPEYPVHLSFSSRSVLKSLQKEGVEYKNLAQQLADVEREGFKRVIVSSVNIFPTDEHELMLRTVEGFSSFSPSQLRPTRALFSHVKTTAAILSELNGILRLSYPEEQILFITHGSPRLDQAGTQALLYARELLHDLHPANHFCSLEGIFPFDTVKESLVRRMKEYAAKRENPAGGAGRVVLVPMLLVSGNHFRKDVQDIRQFLDSHFEATVASPLSGSDHFHLLELESMRQAVVEGIRNEIALSQ